MIQKHRALVVCFTIGLLATGSAAAAVPASVEIQSTTPQFQSEAEFLQKYGEKAVRLSEGNYRIEKSGRKTDVLFGRAAQELLKRELEARITELRRVNTADLQPADAGKLASMQVRQAQLAQQLSRSARKDVLDQPYRKIDDQCGYSFEFYADAARDFASGSASAAIPITSGGNSSSYTDWQARVDVYATVGQFDPSTNTVTSTVYDYENAGVSSLPYATPIASAAAPGYFLCTKSMAVVEVWRGYVFFPNYCLTTYGIVQYDEEPGCPASY